MKVHHLLKIRCGPSVTSCLDFIFRVKCLSSKITRHCFSQVKPMGWRCVVAFSALFSPLCCALCCSLFCQRINFFFSNSFSPLYLKIIYSTWANFHKPSGLQIYCYSSLANRQINLIKAQPSRETFEGSRVQSRNTWGQLTSEQPLSCLLCRFMSWTHVHEQHLQLSQDISIVAGGPRRRARSQQNRHRVGEHMGMGHPNVKAQAQAPKEKG